MIEDGSFFTYVVLYFLFDEAKEFGRWGSGGFLSLGLWLLGGSGRSSYALRLDGLRSSGVNWVTELRGGAGDGGGFRGFGSRGLLLGLLLVLVGNLVEEASEDGSTLGLVAGRGGGSGSGGRCLWLGLGLLFWLGFLSSSSWYTLVLFNDQRKKSINRATYSRWWFRRERLQGQR